MLEVHAAPIVEHGTGNARTSAVAANSTQDSHPSLTDAEAWAALGVGALLSLVGARASVALLFGRAPDQTIREDLRRLKQLLEADELAQAAPIAQQSPS